MDNAFGQCRTYNMQIHNQSLSHHATLKPLQDAHPSPRLCSAVDWCHPRCKKDLFPQRKRGGSQEWHNLGDFETLDRRLQAMDGSVGARLGSSQIGKKGHPWPGRVKFKFGLENCVRSRQFNPNPLPRCGGGTSGSGSSNILVHQRTAG